MGVCADVVDPRPNCPLAFRPQQRSERCEKTITLSSPVTAPKVTAQVNAVPPVVRLKRALACAAVGVLRAAVELSPIWPSVFAPQQ